MGSLFDSITMLRCSSLLSFDGLAFAFGHLFGKCLFAMFLDEADAGGTVRIEQECENLAYPVGKQFAFPDVMVTFSASVQLVFLAA
jgi:hypothetical protein